MNTERPTSAITQLLQYNVEMGNIMIVDFFVTAFGVALPTTGATDAVVIDQGASFVLYQMNGNISQPAGTNIPFPDVLVDVRDQGSGRYFSKSPMHWNTMMGNAQNPYWLAEPWILGGGSNIQIQLTNLSGGNFARVDVTWAGVKAKALQGFDINSLLAPMDFAYGANAR